MAFDPTKTKAEIDALNTIADIKARIRDLTGEELAKLEGIIDRNSDQAKAIAAIKGAREQSLAAAQKELDIRNELHKTETDIAERIDKNIGARRAELEVLKAKLLVQDENADKIRDEIVQMEELIKRMEDGKGAAEQLGQSIGSALNA